MLSSDLYSAVISRLPFSPNIAQNELLGRLCRFVAGESECPVFILNGYAGTGKTSVAGALIQALKSMRRRTVLLAPTGRAAKVAAQMGDGVSSTVHRRIYHPDVTGNIALSPNRDSDTLFILDEASLLADSDIPSRSVLSHLMRHVFSKPHNRLLMIGDLAQLPPVGQTESRAMDPVRIAQLGLQAETFTLDIPERQARGSGILANATAFRYMMERPDSEPVPIQITGYDDVEAVSSVDLPDTLSSSWAEVGKEETIIITRSNLRANDFNNAIRNLVLMAEEPLERGDRLVISKNDYFWSKANRMKTFLANGETVVVTHVSVPEKMYGRYFYDVELYVPAEDTEISAKLMIRSLMSAGPSVPQDEMARLQEVAASALPDHGPESMRALAEDPWLNALQAKFAYCVTCHKAQGGQWRHVYIDMTGIRPDAMTQEFWRWLYTAVTRARDKVFFINPPLALE